MVKNRVQYISEMLIAYFMKAATPSDFMHGSGVVKSSSLGKYNLSIGSLSGAKSVQASAFIPNVSLKISTDKPVQNDKVSTHIRLMVTGSLIIKYMKARGIAILNRYSRLKTKT